jgi:dihydrofolate reductase
VVTRDKELKIAGCLIAHSLEQAIAASAKDDQTFIVGGADIYAQSLGLADTIYITEIQQEVDGDAYFPEIDKDRWRETSREIRAQESPQLLNYHFVTYRRN